MNTISIRTTVNGRVEDLDIPANRTLLEMLREDLQLTGAKEGCGSGDCGACSVMLDGRVVCACLVLAPEAEGRRIETIEGMATNGVLHPLQRKFISDPRGRAIFYNASGTTLFVWGMLAAAIGIR